MKMLTAYTAIAQTTGDLFRHCRFLQFGMSKALKGRAETAASVPRSEPCSMSFMGRPPSGFAISLRPSRLLFPLARLAPPSFRPSRRTHHGPAGLCLNFAPLAPGFASFPVLSSASGYGAETPGFFSVNPKTCKPLGSSPSRLVTGRCRLRRLPAPARLTGWPGASRVGISTPAGYLQFFRSCCRPCPPPRALPGLASSFGLGEIF